MERWNNTLRQCLARFVRMTLSFSKSGLMHEACLLLFLHRFNREGHPAQVSHYPKNYTVTAAFTDYIRSLETQGTTSIGGEIGHIGGKNSAPEELKAFLDGYRKTLGRGIPGLSKISVQTGTSHGGVPLPDGKMAEVHLDFSVLEHTSQPARNTYHLGGAVQHGTSTLPIDVFNQFPRHHTLEIHLATGFQNIVYDQMPDTLREYMDLWVEYHCQDEWQAGWTREQFLSSSRSEIERRRTHWLIF